VIISSRTRAIYNSNRFDVGRLNDLRITISAQVKRGHVTSFHFRRLTVAAQLRGAERSSDAVRGAELLLAAPRQIDHGLLDGQNSFVIHQSRLE